MLVFGLHIIDLVVLVAFLFGIIGLGWWTSRGVKGEKDFYLGGRKLGRALNFFLNFGSMTDSSGAPTTSAEVFRTGAGGIWISLQTLFITPFYWFSTTWFRRVRLVTMADLFIERLNSRSLATAYVLFNIYTSLLLLGFGNVASFKVASAMIVKPPDQYSASEKAMVDQYNEYASLKAQYTAGALPPAQRERFAELDSKVTRGDINSFVSYVKPLPFYIGYSLIVAMYITLGGLKAAAVTDAVQGLLILVFTVFMIPVGLMRIGGLHALHQAVPEFMFRIFGTVTASDYAWYSILGITFTSMVQIFGLIWNMSNAGSAKDEAAARFGQVVGAFTKRIVIIAWMLCGLIAVAMFPAGLADTENVWGMMTKTLLGPGLLGLMLSGMLLGHMPAVGANAINIAGLMARNIYEPIVKGKSQAHYLVVGQILVVVTLALSILCSIVGAGAVKLITSVITLNAFFGAVVLMIFFWRRLSVPAIWLSFIIWIVVIGLTPVFAPNFARLAHNPAFLEMTPQRSITALVSATAQDVAAGHAKKLGEPVQKTVTIPPQPIYFEKVVRSIPDDPNSPMEGQGRFQVEVYMLHLLGAPVSQFNKAGLLAAHWLVDGFLPFFMLVILSYLLPGARPIPADLHRIDGFYAKLKTPIAPTPEEDDREVALTYENPSRFDHLRLFPGTTWEFTKWSRHDVLGFGACWGVVCLILGFLWLVLNVGA